MVFRVKLDLGFQILGLIMSNSFYASPRWSGEILDCSMPMTFDTYSECSYRCIYCFAFFQKSYGGSGNNYLKTKARPVSVSRVINIFEKPCYSQFGEYVKARKVMQWGGMADPFDENEREQGVTLELLKYFRTIEYPLSICTKATWFLDDDRYIEILRGAKHINFKISIVTSDDDIAKKVDVLAPSSSERFMAIRKLTDLGVGGVVLRFRPFIIGISELTMLDVIRKAAYNGAIAVSTEFMCMEVRSSIKGKKRYQALSDVCGFDVLDYYKKYSNSGGYLRLNRKIKEPYVLSMKAECEKLGLRFYVSDAHFKELCNNGSCCGLSEDWNYSRGQFTEALLIAKKNGKVHWSDIENNITGLDFPWGEADGFNQFSCERRAQFNGFTMKGYMHWIWNNVNRGKSPYKYFGGILLPAGLDEKGDVIYEYKVD